MAVVTVATSFLDGTETHNGNHGCLNLGGK